MKNEIDLIKTSNFSVQFEPAKIKIENKETIENAVKEIAKHYLKTVYSENDLAGLQQSHRELNKLRTGLDESRKDVKRKFNEPLEIFENEVKEMIAEIDKPLEEIKEQRDEILEAQEEVRAEALQDYLKKQAEKEKLEISDIEIVDSWTNKGNWTDKLNPRKPLKEEIDRAIRLAVEENKKKIAERELLKQFFENRGQDSEGWIAQLEFREATEIIKQVQEQDELKKKEENLAEKQIEEKEEVEKNPLQEAQEKLSEPEDFSEFYEPEKITNTIQVTGTVEQLQGLNRYLVNSGIEVIQV